MSETSSVPSALAQELDAALARVARENARKTTDAQVQYLRQLVNNWGREMGYWPEEQRKKYRAVEDAFNALQNELYLLQTEREFSRLRSFAIQQVVTIADKMTA